MRTTTSPTLTRVTLAACVALALSLTACGSDGSSGDATTTTAKSADGSTTTTTTVAGGEESGSGSGGSGDTGSNGSGSGGSGGSSAPAGPRITSFGIPSTVDCAGGGVRDMNVSWSTAGADRVTISIDGPGIYAEYPANGQTTIPFSCGSSHTYLLTAYGPDGDPATKTVTVSPTNEVVPNQGEGPDEGTPEADGAQQNQGGGTGQSDGS